MKAENKLKRKRKEKRMEREKERERNRGNEVEESEEEQEIHHQQEQEGRMEEEGVNEEEREKMERARENNLLLKYDLNREDFHFVRGKARKVEEKQSKQEDEDVAFVDGKIVFREIAKRKRENDNLQEEEEAE